VVALQTANAMRTDVQIGKEAVHDTKVQDLHSSKDHASSSTADSNDFVPSSFGQPGRRHTDAKVWNGPQALNMITLTDFDEVKDSAFTEEFMNTGLLDVGIFGNVHAVQHRESGKEYAMKTISREMFVDDVEREVALQELVESDHIVSIYKSFRKETGDYVIMTELMPDGELSKKIRNSGGLFRGLDVRDVFHQVVDGVAYCHQYGVVHLDLQPANMWLKGKQVKIGDFGFAREVQGSSSFKDAGGIRYKTRAYLPPEVLRRYVNSSAKAIPLDLKAVDVWSLGVTFYEILSGRLPWKGMKIISGKDAHGGFLVDRKGVAEFLDLLDENGLDELYVPLPQKVDKDASDLIQHMLKLDPSERYTMEEVESHKYFEPLVAHLQQPHEKHMQRLEASFEKKPVKTPNIWPFNFWPFKQFALRVAIR
jgi:serine/threonine protein kinase